MLFLRTSPLHLNHFLLNLNLARTFKLCMYSLLFPTDCLHGSCSTTPWHIEQWRKPLGSFFFNCFKNDWKFNIYNNIPRVREITQQLRAAPLISEDPSSKPSTQGWQLAPTCSPSSRWSDALFQSLQGHAHTGIPDIHRKKTKLKFNKQYSAIIMTLALM